ncbi:MAG: hypothetical protein CMD92_01540 [Gammaproteobacteria bacterium]|nr:hypothetical protein [Gammaproteobacteria bacterium]HBW85091.1 hypothetical protein [Gammaproteobacteria bacterium]
MAPGLQFNTDKASSSNAIKLTNLTTKKQIMPTTHDKSDLYIRAVVSQELTPKESIRLNQPLHGLFQTTQLAQCQSTQGRLISKISVAWNQKPLGIPRSPFERLTSARIGFCMPKNFSGM